MERGMTADQVLRALWRRKLLIAAIAGGVFVVGAAFVMVQPSLYEATVVVRVEPQRPAPEMVQPTVSQLIEQRLLTVRQELLGRPVLQKAIQEMGLYPDIVTDDGMDAAVERMRKDLTVRIEGENAFELTYRSVHPELAGRVANRLPEIFAEETVKVRQAQAARATQLFNDEVKSLNEAVAAWESKIARFKVEHMGELPEQLEMNMRALERIAARLQTKSEELRVAEARRSELARARHAADSEAGRLQAAEDGLTRSLVAARTTWAADHPELQRLTRELEDMRAQRKEAERRMVAERQERVRADQLVGEIQKETEELRAQAAAFQERLDRTPRWAHELAVMQRDYEIARTKYQSVISRKVEAEIAQGLEAKNAKNLFNVISPAGTPTKPAKPDRFTGVLISLLAGLGLAVLTAVVLEMRDDSIRDSHELRERLPIPLLAVVPDMNGSRGERRVLLPAGSARPPKRT